MTRSSAGFVDCTVNILKMFNSDLKWPTFFFLNKILLVFWSVLVFLLISLITNAPYFSIFYLRAVEFYVGILVPKVKYITSVFSSQFA